MANKEGNICWKVVQRGPDGNLYSAVVREPKEGDGDQYRPISYTPDHDTTAPEETPGCFAFNGRVAAERLATGLGHDNCEVWEAAGNEQLPLPLSIDMEICHPKGWVDAEGKIHGSPTPVSTSLPEIFPKPEKESIMFNAIRLVRGVWPHYKFGEEAKREWEWGKGPRQSWLSKVFGRK